VAAHPGPAGRLLNRRALIVCGVALVVVAVACIVAFSGVLSRSRTDADNTTWPNRFAGRWQSTSWDSLEETFSQDGGKATIRMSPERAAHMM